MFCVQLVYVKRGKTEWGDLEDLIYIHLYIQKRRRERRIKFFYFWFFDPVKLEG